MRYTILDIETRIDKRLVRQVYHPDADLSDEDAYSQVRQQLKQEQGSDFFPISFHIPVSIAVGQVDEEHVLTAVETLAGEDADEETMVRTFWQRLDRFRARWSRSTDAVSTCPSSNSRLSDTAVRRRTTLAARPATVSARTATTTCTTLSPTTAPSACGGVSICWQK